MRAPNELRNLTLPCIPDKLWDKLGGRGTISKNHNIQVFALKGVVPSCAVQDLSLERLRSLNVRNMGLTTTGASRLYTSPEIVSWNVHIHNSRRSSQTRLRHMALNWQCGRMSYLSATEKKSALPVSFLPLVCGEATVQA